MVRKEQIEVLMAQVGPVVNPLGVVAFPGENSWGVQLDEDMAILVDFDEAQGKLVLSCEIGMPPTGDRARLYELLLRQNFHWDQTGGLRMAIDGAEGNVVQIFDLPAADLDVSSLHGIIRRFAEAARGWREIVSRPVGTRLMQAEDFGDMPMIRV